MLTAGEWSTNHVFLGFMTCICGDYLCVRKMDGHYYLEEDDAPDRVDSIHGHCKIYYMSTIVHINAIKDEEEAHNIYMTTSSYLAHVDQLIGNYFARFLNSFCQINFNA